MKGPKKMVFVSGWATLHPDSAKSRMDFTIGKHRVNSVTQYIHYDKACFAGDSRAQAEILTHKE